MLQLKYLFFLPKSTFFISRISRISSHFIYLIQVLTNITARQVMGLELLTLGFLRGPWVL